jgi:hypothetical protein
MGRSIGRGIREFKGSMMDDDTAPTPAPREAPRTTATAVATTAAQEDDDVLEGVVVPGDTPPGGDPPGRGAG